MLMVISILFIILFKFYPICSFQYALSKTTLKISKTICFSGNRFAGFQFLHILFCMIQVVLYDNRVTVLSTEVISSLLMLSTMNPCYFQREENAPRVLKC